MKSNALYRSLIVGISGALMLALLGLIVIGLAQESRQSIDKFGAVPEFSFVNQNGEVFGRHELSGKINIINFFFTSCQGPCPYMNSKVAELYQKYATTDLVRFISISVDPETDTQEILRNYAARFGVTDNRWQFLRGQIDEVQNLTEHGFHLAGELPNLHSTKLILVDAEGYIRGYYDSFNAQSLDLLTLHTKELLRGIL